MGHVESILEQWGRERPDLDVTSMGLTGRLKRVARIIQAEMESVFATHGLNLASFDVLATLRRSGGVRRPGPQTRCPPMRTDPAATDSRPAMTRSSVDLPHPDRPRITQTSPVERTKLTPRRTRSGRRYPKSTRSSSRSVAGADGSG